MDEIIPGLFLSGVESARSLEKLGENSIESVVCCLTLSEFGSEEEHPNIKYCRIDVEDVSREPIELYFDEASEFISGALDGGEHVLVHCRSGVSRSPTVILSFLIKSYGMSLCEAFHLVRSKHRIHRQVDET